MYESEKGSDQRMKSFFFDIPNLHFNSDIGVEFIGALNKTKNVNLFALPAV